MQQLNESILHYAMRFIIRAHASMEIGTGHVMRVSAIAEELIDRHLDVVFVGDINGRPWVNERITSMGFSAIHTSASTFTRKMDSDVLILDSYTLDPQDSFIDLERWNAVVASVDDATPAFSANLYIHSGPGTNWKTPSECSGSPYLSGIRYVAIRKSIREIVRTPNENRDGVLHITVVGGGSDSRGFCLAIPRLLHTLDCSFIAMVFTNHQERDFFDSRIHYLPTGSNFEATLANTELVLTSAGTSSWELLSLDLPIGVAFAAENQFTNYNFLLERGLAVDIGFLDSSNLWSLNEDNIKSLVENFEIRNSLQRVSRTAFDVRGVERIADAITHISF